MYSMYKCFPFGASSLFGDRKAVKIDALLFSDIILMSDDATVVLEPDRFSARMMFPSV